jgi:tetratricopeptide (TPR) repeat protein
VRPALAKTLGLTSNELDDLLTSDVDPTELDPVVEVLPQDTERAEARSLLATLAVTALNPPVEIDPGWAEPFDRQTSPAPLRIGMTDIERVRAATGSLRAIDRLHGGGVSRDPIAAHVRQTQQFLHSDATDDVRRELLIELADQHNLAGWASFDVGMYSTARKHYARAIELAQHAGESSLTADLLHNMARLHLHRGLHDEARRFYQIGVMAAQDTGHPRTMAVLYANRAWTYALLDKRTEALCSITQAQDEFANAGDGDVLSWSEFMNDAELHTLTGYTLTKLPDATDDDLATGIEHITTSINLRTAEWTRSRIMDLPMLAAAHLRAGNTDEALHVTDHAINEAQTLSSVLPIDRLAELTSAIATVGSPDAQDIVHRIDELVAAKG